MNFQQIKSQNAYTTRARNFDIVKDGEVTTIENAEVFKSYESICAVYDIDTTKLYLLPRYDFSPTTIRQLANWIRSFTKTIAQSVKFYREIENGKRQDDDYIVCDGYLNRYGEVARY